MKNNQLKLILPAIFLMIMVGIHAQNVRVTGVVSDAQSPLIGVNVHVKGGTTGVITDMNGKYSIEVPSNATLVFSYIGYADQEHKVGNRKVIDVTMSEDSKLLEEIVVVGYGYQKKSDIATSVASVKTDEMKSFPAGNVGDMLRGRVAGVNVTSSSGRPGSAPTITIRGNRSISAQNTPLYVIDGSVSSSEEFSTLSAESIESIEILKDAASQAIYGARASDGVILVTTKRGKSGRAEVNLKAKFGLNYFKDSYNFMNAGDYLYWMRTGYMNAYVGDMKHPDGAGIKGWSSLSGLTTATPYGTGNLYFDKDGVTPLDGNKTSSAIWSPMLYSDNLSFLLDQGWQTMIDPIYGDKIIYPKIRKQSQWQSQLQ